MKLSIQIQFDIKLKLFNIMKKSITAMAVFVLTLCFALVANAAAITFGEMNDKIPTDSKVKILDVDSNGYFEFTDTCTNVPPERVRFFVNSVETERIFYNWDSDKI
ncbi:MAG: hypothetical protein PF588_10385, partial [Candidatus Kapabacteria bacterium]|nr:hypothetical protein [Candidatus Kapabacteria bacterium]